MILSGHQILEHLGKDIVIEPFDRSRLNPNSYNMALYHELLVYEELVLDMKKRHRVSRLEIPPEGLVLKPQQLYLGRTVERTETHKFVPMLEGRSSIGRLGLFVHITAGFGDVGFCGFWTLEMFCVQPIRVYPGVAIAQVFYHTLDGPFEEYVSEKYQDSDDIRPSMLYKELSPGEDQQLKLRFGQDLP